MTEYTIGVDISKAFLYALRLPHGADQSPDPQQNRMRQLMLSLPKAQHMTRLKLIETQLTELKAAGKPSKAALTAIMRKAHHPGKHTHSRG